MYNYTHDPRKREVLKEDCCASYKPIVLRGLHNFFANLPKASLHNDSARTQEYGECKPDQIIASAYLSAALSISFGWAIKSLVRLTNSIQDQGNGGGEYSDRLNSCFAGWSVPRGLQIILPTPNGYRGASSMPWAQSRIRSVATVLFVSDSRGQSRAEKALISPNAHPYASVASVTARRAMLLEGW